MEDLSKSWKKLLLTEKEESGFVLTKVQRKNEFLLATKFFTTRALNMEAMGQTFKQVWRCSNGFMIRKMNDHKVLFGFDDGSDVNRILLNQPWSFDKHLVVVMRYEKDIPLQSFSFYVVMFWV